MPIRPISHVCSSLFALLLLGLATALPTRAQDAHTQDSHTQDANTNEPTTDSVFADAPFEKWKAEGPKEQVKWQVKMTADKLSIHQRLIATIQVQVPGPELLKRSQDDHIVLLVEVRNGEGVSSRNFGVLELNNLKPEMKRSDIEFSWQAFAVPGQYEMSVALWDKKSGEHNFAQRLFHVDAYKNDPLPGMWKGLDAFEFWSTKRDGPEYIFHSDIEGQLHLPLETKRPLQLQVLMDMTPSAAIFRGNYGNYNRYIAAAVPVFKVFSEISVANGANRQAVLDLVQRRVPFEQKDGKPLDWARFSRALMPDNGPGVVSVRDLQNRQQSPVFLREEIVHRISDPATQVPASHVKPEERPLRVFVIIGSPMDLYAFPSLPAIETGNEEDCIIYYLMFDFFEHEHASTHDQMRPSNRGFNRDRINDRESNRFEHPGFSGNLGNLEKMLKPLKMRSFLVRSPDDARHALAKIMEEVGRL
jgi:hypothetical protein